MFDVVFLFLIRKDIKRFCWFWLGKCLCVIFGWIACIIVFYKKFALLAQLVK